MESINKLTYGEEVESFIEETLTEKSKYVNGEVKDKITENQTDTKNWKMRKILRNYYLPPPKSLQFLQGFAGSNCNRLVETRGGITPC